MTSTATGNGGRGHAHGPILVTGGTGTLGRLVVPRLRDAGCEVRVLSRRSHEAEEGIDFVTGDLATGEGIQAAVEGAETIVHCAGSSKGDEDKALNLVRAASSAGAAHLVYISVVGADRIPIVSGVDRTMFGYFASKLAAERVVADSGLPWTTLRATQFHDLFLTTAQQMARLPVIPVPTGFRLQPVDAGDVAARLVELALGPPAGLAPDMAGRASTAWPSCCATPCGPVASTGRSCRSGCPARPPAHSGPARTWRRTGLWAAGRGRSSWPLPLLRARTVEHSGGHESPAAGVGVMTSVPAVSGAGSWPPMSRRKGG
jgi:uncharacterized protein YbjT (DUF2867 family)